jgi:hypothetical protein
VISLFLANSNGVKLHHRNADQMVHKFIDGPNISANEEHE